MPLVSKIKRNVKRVINKMAGNETQDLVLIRGLQNISIDMEPDEKLQLFRNKFNVARAAIDLELLDDREVIYDGTHSVDKNINNQRADIDEKLSNQPYGIAYELLESQVDNSIPQPTVKSKRKEYKYQAKMIEDAIKNDLLDTRINKINDKGERTCFKQGYTAVEVFWNANRKSHSYTGEIELRHRHPKTLIPQVGVWDWDLMDYFFTYVSTTKQAVWQEFGIELTNETEEFPQVNTIGDQPYTNNLAEKVTVITCWYKDSEGEIGKFTWCRNKVLEDYPQYFYRRPMKCDKCGKYQEDNKKKCECGGKFHRVVEKFEKLTEDKVLQRVKAAKDPKTGQPIMQINPQTGQQEPTYEQVVIPKGTEIPYYAPKCWPLVFRVNVPSDFGVGGVSDIDVIRDKYMAISKLMNNIEEKVLHHPTIIAKLKEHKITIQNLIYQVIECDDVAQLKSLKTLDLSADITKDLLLVQELYKQAQNLLGVTDSFQGKPDPTARSYVAKQLQIAQASGRMASKQFNKFDFYKQLFQTMFEFKLAFYDELRPVVSKDDDGEDLYFDFDKYEFLLFDQDLNGSKGGWYYNTDFIFQADNSGGWERNRDFMYQQTMQLKGIGAFDPTPQNVMLWGMLDNLNFPNASVIKGQLQQQIEEQKQQQQKMMQADQQANQIPGGHTGGGNPFQELTDNMSPEELDQIEQNPEMILQEMQGLQGGQQ